MTEKQFDILLNKLNQILECVNRTPSSKKLEINEGVYESIFDLCFIETGNESDRLNSKSILPTILKVSSENVKCKEVVESIGLDKPNIQHSSNFHAFMKVFRRHILKESKGQHGSEFTGVKSK